MTDGLCEKLLFLADKYERTDFLESDPSQFLRRYPDLLNAETFSFVTAMLSFGNRKQFIPKITYLGNLADSKSGCFYNWILNGDFESSFLPPDTNPDQKFYRFYSYADMIVFFREFRVILQEHSSLGDFLHARIAVPDQSPRSLSLSKGHIASQAPTRVASPLPIDQLISGAFPKSKIVPKGKTSANKRIFMFLRWMVRQNSPVDLGLWTWYSPADLIIPLDVHVMQESQKLGLLPPNTSPSRKTAQILTSELKKIWSTDPCKGDFALFGLGVDS